MFVERLSFLLFLATARSVGGSTLSLYTSNECHGKYQTEPECDADDACSWCECSAIPSACYDLSDISSLPAGVFQCSKSSNLVSFVDSEFRPVDPDWDKIKSLACLFKQSDRGFCLENKSLNCTWCELTEPQNGVEDVCFPGFAADNLIDQGIVSSCESTELKGDWRGLECGFKSDSDSCLADENCSWCDVTIAILKEQMPHMCASKLAVPQMISMKWVDNCDGAVELKADVQGKWDSFKCMEQLSHDDCFADKLLNCEWCKLAEPIQGFSELCQPDFIAEKLVQSGLATSCEKKSTFHTHRAPVTESPFESTHTLQTFVYDDLCHVLSDNTVDPNFCDPDSPKSLAGYVSLEGSKYDKPGEDKHYFYWFFESRAEADENTPFFIWLTGGPGCSSSLALLAENGPCSVNEDGTATVPNPSSWNTNAHALWLDQPAGVGFSYGKVDDHSEDMVGENAYYFLQSFLQSHPEYAKNPLFITGESYAGHYVPAIAHRIWKGNQKNKKGTIYLNLQGLAIGNGLTNPEVQYPQYAEMAYKNSHGIQVIGEKEYESMVAATSSCTYLIHKCNSVNKENPGPMEIFYCQSAGAVCNAIFMVPYELTGLNPYDIREPCKELPLCYDFSNINTFLNAESTKQALHISKESSRWESCSFGVHSHFMVDWMKDNSFLVADVLNAGIRVLVYAGDVDFICNYIGNRAWTVALDWDHKDEFNAAEDKEWNNNTGLAKSSNGLTYLQVYEAGHMVPMNQPEVANKMINKFFRGEDF